MAEVRLSARAVANLLAHDDWLRARNPQAADRLADDVERSMRLLSEHPFAGRAIAGTSLRVIRTHRYRYRIAYRATEATVEIERVYHPRQSGPF